MQCPKCMFDQPDDKYCANCGLDVEAYLARPKPIFLKIFQNPSFYGLMIGGILVLMAAYIFVNQRSVGQQVGRLLHRGFVLSRDAADPNEVADAASHSAVEEDEIEDEPTAAAPLSAVASQEAQATAPAEAAPALTKMEVGFFELSKESVSALTDHMVRDAGDWKVLYFEDAKDVEGLKTASAHLPGARERSLQKDANDVIELDAGDLNPDARFPYLAIGVDWNRNEHLRFAVGMQIPAGSARGVAEAAPASGEAPSYQKTSFDGTLNFKPQGALLLVYDPPNRTAPGMQELSRLERSPLRVLASDDFKAGYSDLIVWIRCK